MNGGVHLGVLSSRLLLISERFAIQGLKVSVMVKPAERRKRKYERKLDPEGVARAFDAQKEDMVEQEASYQPLKVMLEKKVKKICEAAGVSTPMIAQYIAYGEVIWRLRQKFSGPTLQSEAQHQTDLWASRGLDGDLMQKIAATQGCAVTAPMGKWLPRKPDFDSGIFLIPRQDVVMVEHGLGTRWLLGSVMVGVEPDFSGAGDWWESYLSIDAVKENWLAVYNPWPDPYYFRVFLWRLNP